VAFPYPRGRRLGELVPLDIGDLLDTFVILGHKRHKIRTRRFRKQRLWGQKRNRLVWEKFHKTLWVIGSFSNAPRVAQPCRSELVVSVRETGASGFMLLTLTSARCVALWRAAARWPNQRGRFRGEHAAVEAVGRSACSGRNLGVRFVSMTSANEGHELAATQVLSPCRDELLEATGTMAVEQLLAAAQGRMPQRNVVIGATPKKNEYASATGAARLLDASECALWVLNRPSALNALSLPMVQALRRRCLEYLQMLVQRGIRDGLYAPDMLPALLFVASSSCQSLFPRSWHLVPMPKSDKWQLELAALSSDAPARRPFFCAGGDIREIYRHGLPDGDRRMHRLYFEEEYRLNHLLAGGLGGMQSAGVFGETFVQLSLLDGIVMGGGVGLSIHGRFRVATENTLFAMPECGIGFHPDVGASWFLPRLLDWKREGGSYSRSSMKNMPSAESIALGAWMAVTGARIQGADAVRLGIATHYCPSDRLNELVAQSMDLWRRTRSGRRVSSPWNAIAELDSLLQSFQGDIDTSWQAFGTARIQEITRLFDPSGGQRSLRDIWKALHDALKDPRKVSFAQECLAAMGRCSPLSMLIAFESVGIRGPSETTLADCLVRELTTTLHCLRHPDFMEGVRAQLVDKDRAPRWKSAASLTTWFESHDDERTRAIVSQFFKPIAEEHPLDLDQLSPEINSSPSASFSTRAGVAPETTVRAAGPRMDRGLPHSSL
jgi:enoyl-CoA hydratase/carnithine racemase